MANHWITPTDADRMAVEAAIEHLKQMDGWQHALAVEMMREALAMCREQCDDYPRHAPNCAVHGANNMRKEANHDK